MIRHAELCDLESISTIVKAVCQEMRITGNDQWGKDYPQAIDFMIDIEKKELYVSEIDNRITGFICINYHEPEEYQNVKWAVNEKPMVIHRMAIHTECRNQGIGTMLMEFAEELAKSRGVSNLRSDTYSLNPKMNALFRKLNYQFAGQIHFVRRANPFNCYEKMLI